MEHKGRWKWKEIRQQGRNREPFCKNGAVVDLYAQWSRDTYKITYKTNGGELADGTAKKYNVDTRTFKLKTPVRYGYIFKGWYKDKNAPDVSHRSKRYNWKSDLLCKVADQ